MGLNGNPNSLETCRCPIAICGDSRLATPRLHPVWQWIFGVSPMSDWQI